MIGLVGKLPAHGDFVRRGGPIDVLVALDRWLDDELGAAPTLIGRIEALGAWGFAIRIAGQAMIGAIVASEDRVGRRFPLVGVLTDDGASVDVRRWTAAAVRLLAQARDARLTADEAAALLGDLPRPVGERATGWWRHDGDAVLPHPALPAGADFARLFGGYPD